MIVWDPCLMLKHSHVFCSFYIIIIFFPPNLKPIIINKYKQHTRNVYCKHGKKDKN